MILVMWVSVSLPGKTIEKIKPEKIKPEKIKPEKIKPEKKQK